MSVLMGYHIKRVELIIRENVRTFFPQGQSKLSVIMGVHNKQVFVKRGLTVEHLYFSKML